MRLNRKIKKAFPSLYEFYQHLKRKRTIRNINKIKNESFERQLKLLEETYEKRIGHPLDWSSLNTYTEKMQWEKVYHRDPIKTLLADKYAVRAWVKEKIGEEHLIPIYGVWDSFDKIDFNTLPDSFVLKTNHGRASLAIVKNKAAMPYRQTKRKFDDWMAMDFAYINNGLQLHYSGISPKIIAEKYMETDGGELQDYKFLCFDGTPAFCWVDSGRFSGHIRAVFDMDWKRQPWTEGRHGVFKEPVPRPKNFKKMIEIATALCEGFAHVRVDLYNVDGAIYFGEMTFTNGNGFTPILPEEYDLALGKLWNMDTKSE